MNVKKFTVFLLVVIIISIIGLSFLLFRYFSSSRANKQSSVLTLAELCTEWRKSNCAEINENLCKAIAGIGNFSKSISSCKSLSANEVNLIRAACDCPV